MSEPMIQRFCMRCGAKTLPPARFCVDCGAPLNSGASAAKRGLPVGRWAPAAIFLTVIGTGALTVWLGSRSAGPPAVVPPRQAANAPAAGGMPSGQLPEGHPPLSLPEDVRQKIQQMAEAAKSKPDDLDTWRQLGGIQYRAGQFEPRFLGDAADTFRHVLEKQPNDAEALRALGNVAYDRDQPEEAIAYYKRYLEVRPDDPDVLTDLGTMYLSARDLPQAVQTYEKVLARDPKFYQAQFNLAVARKALGDTAAAVKALERAREIAPDDARRKQVDDVLARLAAAPAGAPAENPAAPVAAAPPPAPASDAGGNARAAIESLFRNHPIVGSKLDRFEWTDAQNVKVIVHQFPMETMPPFARDMFIQRIKGGLKEKKLQHAIAAAVRVEVVDAASGKTMETIEE